jgi:hypothetical protein
MNDFRGLVHNRANLSPVWIARLSNAAIHRALHGCAVNSEETGELVWSL